jgi:hypothetical protein
VSNARGVVDDAATFVARVATPVTALQSMTPTTATAVDELLYAREVVATGVDDVVAAIRVLVNTLQPSNSNMVSPSTNAPMQCVYCVDTAAALTPLADTLANQSLAPLQALRDAHA